MIFVTVGTHEQQFNRLIEYIDQLKEKNIIAEEVLIQTGYSTYEPIHCKWRKMFPYKEMETNMKEARIIITHGGPSSFILPLQIKKVPIVVPRSSEFKEHVNDHQISFVKAVSERYGSIIPVYNISDLKDRIVNYDEIVKSLNNTFTHNNQDFNNKFQNIINDLMD